MNHKETEKRLFIVQNLIEIALYAQAEVIAIASILVLVLNLIIKISIEVVGKWSFGGFKETHSILLETSKSDFHALDWSWIFVALLFKLILRKVLAFGTYTEASEQKWVDREGEESSLSVLGILVVGVSDQVKRSYRVFQIKIVFVVTVREDKQLKILDELPLLFCSHVLEQSREEFLCVFDQQRIDTLRCERAAPPLALPFV
jgi:hypothetical protein